MNRIILLLLVFPIFTIGQIRNQGTPPNQWNQAEALNYIQKTVNPSQKEIARLEAKKEGLYMCASLVPTPFRFSDFSLTDVQADGSKIYKLRIESKDALGLRVAFDQLELPIGTKLWVYNPEKTEYQSLHDPSFHVTDKQLTSSIIHGSQIIICIEEPKNIQLPDFQITGIHHFFRGLKSSNGFRTSQACMINIGCAEGAGYTEEQAATCRILVTMNSGSGWCTGTLMNNTSENLDPLILTANHCSESSTFANLNSYEFHFFYHSTDCNTPFSEPDFYRFTGATYVAASGQDYGNRSSDFLLLRLKSPLPDLRGQGVDFTLMGWNRSGDNSPSGVGIHHPDGDIKKISTQSGSTAISSYKGIIPNTHFSLRWGSTGIGRHSTTQGGSSGSGLLNSQKLLIGTLTGGESDCFTLNGLDFYGRLSRHWDTYGSANDERVDRHLDPGNTGAITCRTIKRSTGPLNINSTQLTNVQIHREQENLKIEGISNYTLNIYNLQGQKVHTMHSEKSTNTISLAHFSNGIYIIELEKNEQRQIQKIYW